MENDKNIFWLIDCSGSMYGERIGRVEEIVRTVIRSTLIPDESVTHTIINFSTNAYVNHPIYNKEQLDRFKFPTVGGLTELDKALVCLYGQITSIRKDTEIYIILAMDGYSTNPITNEVKNLWNIESYRNAYKFSIQIGKDTDKAMFDAVLGDGYSVIELNDDDNHFVPTKGLISWIHNYEATSDDFSDNEVDWVTSPVEAYSGSQPFIFVSYAHFDKELVFPILSHMIHSGYRVWYDDGIDPGTEWDDNIASHVQECSCFVAFISRNYLDSDNCKDELNYARDLKKERLLVYMEDVELPAGMAMRLNRLQAIYWNTYKDKRAFYTKLFTSSPFELCKKEVFEKQRSGQDMISIPADVDSQDKEDGDQYTGLKEISETAVALGVDVESNSLVSLDLCKTRSIAIYGKKGFGKSNMLSLLIEGAKQIPNIRFVCWDDGRKQLSQNEALNKMIQTAKQSVKILYSGQEFLDYLEKNGYYSFDTFITSYPLLEEDSSIQSELEIPKENPFTVFIIQSRMFYQNFDVRNNLIRKLAPYIINESYGNKIFVFSDVQNIMDYEMRQEFNNFIDHAFLLDDITRFISGKGEKTIFGYLDVMELKDKYGARTTKLGEGFHYDVESDEITKVKFYKYFT